jgi:hypothetical protein
MRFEEVRSRLRKLEAVVGLGFRF